MRRRRATAENALEVRLRAERPVAPATLLAAVVPAEAPARRAAASGVVFAAGLTVAIAAALLLVGGVSYAATALTHAGDAVRGPAGARGHASPRTVSSGGDQYRPGYGFGDPNHEHAGPPGLAVASEGQKAPPIQPKPSPDRKASLVTSTITIDEQAALYFSVLDAKGRQLLLTQNGTTIGGRVTGPQTKTIHYVMLVPRTIVIRIRIPANLVAPGSRYSIRVIAVDPQGNKSRMLIPFTA